MHRRAEQPAVKRHLALIGLLLAATGCGASSSADHGRAPASTGSATVTGTDAFRFAPARLTVKAGDVTLRMTASGSYPHNIAVPQLHQTSQTVGTAPGSARSALLELHDLRSGVYRFICTFHSKAGMTGELVVQ
jgi:plastocyanin